jgi:hypothetical protein
MPNLTPAQIEQYYRVRLDPYKLHPSKGMEYRATCPLHGGNNASSFWVNLSEGNFFCFSCQEKGPSPYVFEQKMQALELGYVPEHDIIQRKLEQIIGMPFTQRVYTEPLKKEAKGWDRRQSRDFYRYTDEWGKEVCTVWRFVDRQGKKLTPPDHPCVCQTNKDAECEPGCVGGRVWGAAGVRRVLYRLPELIQSFVVFIVEGEKNANDLSRALAAYIAKHKGFPVSSTLTVDHVAVTTNIGGSSGWKKEYKYGRYFFGKFVIKLGDNDAPGKMHNIAVCEDVAPYASRVMTLDLPVGDSEDISNYLENNTVDDFVKLLPNCQDWMLPKSKEIIIGKESLEPRRLLIKPSELVAPGDPGGDWLVDRLIQRGMRGLIIAKPKTGKAQPFDAPVLTPLGWKKMGEITILDQVIGEDGSPKQVLAVHPQGVMQTYRVTICDGAEVETCGNHLWKIQSHQNRVDGKWVTKTTMAIRDEIAAGRLRAHYLPLVSPVTHSKLHYPIAPYTMGALLGDGTFRLSNTIGFTTADEDIAERVGRECDGITRQKNRFGYYVKMKLAKRRLTALGLWGLMAYEKHIPAEYQFGSIEQRLDLLRGLLDTDGCFEAGKLITFCSSSKQLADDVRSLIQSLGGTARMNTKETFYKKDGVRIDCRTAYRLSIKLPRELGNPFYCKRKAKQWSDSTVGTKKKPTRSIVSVEPSRLCECQCLTVEGGLYVTNEYIVTHNSLFMLDIAISLATQGRVLGLRPYHRPVRVAVISREDGPQLLSDRIKMLATGRNLSMYDVDKNLRVNTEEQSKRFKIDNQADLEEMAQWLRAEMIEFCIIDVLARLHFGKENSADDMTKVMLKFDELSQLSGSQICVIHHSNAEGEGRGSTAIDGWADYIFRLENDLEDQALKKLSVRTKSSGHVVPKIMRYKQSDDMKESRIELVQ